MNPPRADSPSVRNERGLPFRARFLLRSFHPPRATCPTGGTPVATGPQLSRPRRIASEYHPSRPAETRRPSRSSPMRYLFLGVIPLLAAADFPAADKLPANRELPDPLVMLDGSKIKSPDDWRKKRRPELKQLFQH